MSVARCMEEVDGEEFTRWQAYWKVEPFGQEWQQTALICLVMASAWSKKGSGEWKLEDFLPIKPEKERQTSEQIESVFRLLARPGKKTKPAAVKQPVPRSRGRKR